MIKVIQAVIAFVYVVVAADRKRSERSSRLRSVVYSSRCGRHVRSSSTLARPVGKSVQMFWADSNSTIGRARGNFTGINQRATRHHKSDAIDTRDLLKRLHASTRTYITPTATNGEHDGLSLAYPPPVEARTLPSPGFSSLLPGE